jgi:hypothetical protein
MSAGISWIGDDYEDVDRPNRATISQVECMNKMWLRATEKTKAAPASPPELCPGLEDAQKIVVSAK